MQNRIKLDSRSPTCPLVPRSGRRVKSRTSFEGMTNGAGMKYRAGMTHEDEIKRRQVPCQDMTPY